MGEGAYDSGHEVENCKALVPECVFHDWAEALQHHHVNQKMKVLDVGKSGTKKRPVATVLKRAVTCKCVEREIVLKLRFTELPHEEDYGIDQHESEGDSGPLH